MKQEKEVVAKREEEKKPEKLPETKSTKEEVKQNKVFKKRSLFSLIRIFYKFIILDNFVFNLI